jgi:O-acetyl-ADP-ribose deacetylase (regulator of RNase III)
VLDPQDIVDADLNVAELSAVDSVAHGGGVHWTMGHMGAHELKGAVQQAAKLGQGWTTFVGEADLASALSDALKQVQQLPSPFRG